MSKERLKQIEKEIKSLEKEKKTIEESLISSATTFNEKFRLWYNNGKKGHKSWILGEEEYPLLRKFIENGDFPRYKTIDLEYLVGDEVLALFLDDKYISAFKTEEDYQNEVSKYQPAMEEAMRNNMKSFEMDW